MQQVRDGMKANARPLDSSGNTDDADGASLL
jgi:hypothetical protein